MDIYPAIDLRHGRVVRLSQGEATRQTRYGDDPAATAEAFVAAGARWIHLVDLDRAFGDGDQIALIGAIAARVGDRAAIQVGGGIRDLPRVRALLALPVARVVLGTAAVTDPAMLTAALTLAGPGRLAVGIDARDGFVAVRGWQETTGVTVAALGAQVRDAGVRTVIYTDIARDGMLTGPDVAGATALQAQGMAVIASGGVASLDDLRQVAAAGLAGAIVGRALYEHSFHLDDALRLADGAAC